MALIFFPFFFFIFLFRTHSSGFLLNLGQIAHHIKRRHPEQVAPNFLLLTIHTCLFTTDLLYKLNSSFFFFFFFLSSFPLTRTVVRNYIHTHRSSSLLYAASFACCFYGR